MSVFLFKKNISNFSIFFRKNKKIIIVISSIIIILFYDALKHILESIYLCALHIPNSFNENIYRFSLTLCAVVGIYFAWWRARCYDMQNSIQNENYITDRLFKLHTQLNSSDHNKRVVAIKLLWRIAENANFLDKITILTIFNDYINNNAKTRYDSCVDATENARDIISIFDCLQFYSVKLNIDKNYAFIFRNVNLRHLNLCSFSSANSTFSNIDFTGTSFDGSQICSAIVSNCIFSHMPFCDANIKRSIIKNSYFHEVSFDNTFFENTEIENCFFDRCSFDKEAFKRSKIINSNFHDCYFVYFHDFKFDKRFLSTYTKASDLEKIEENIFLEGIEYYSGISFEKNYHKKLEFQNIIDSKKMFQKSKVSSRQIRKRINVKPKRRLSC